MTVGDVLDRENAVLNAQNIEKTKQRFHIGTDPETGKTELISKDMLTDQSIIAASMSPGMSSHAWIKKPGEWTEVVDLNKATQATKDKLDIASKRSLTDTPNLLKQSSEMVDKATKAEPQRLVDYMALNHTPEGSELALLIKKSGIDDSIAGTIMNAAQQIKDPKMRRASILNALQRYCK